MTSILSPIFALIAFFSLSYFNTSSLSQNLKHSPLFFHIFFVLLTLHLSKFFLFSLSSPPSLSHSVSPSSSFSYISLSLSLSLSFSRSLFLFLLSFLLLFFISYSPLFLFILIPLFLLPLSILISRQLRSLDINVFFLKLVIYNSVHLTNCSPTTTFSQSITDVCHILINRSFPSTALPPPSRKRLYGHVSSGAAGGGGSGQDCYTNKRPAYPSRSEY